MNIFILTFKSCINTCLSFIKDLINIEDLPRRFEFQLTPGEEPPIMSPSHFNKNRGWIDRFLLFYLTERKDKIRVQEVIPSDHTVTDFRAVS